MNLEIWPQLADAFEEQPSRRNPEPFRLRHGGNWQRLHGQFVPAGNVWASPAGGEDPQLGGGGKYSLQIGDRRHDVLERVEHNKRASVGQMLGEAPWRAAPWNAQGSRDGGDQQWRILVGWDRQVIHPTLEGHLE